MWMSVWLLTVVVITHARTARAPFSVSAAGVSVWTRTGSPASVSISDQRKESGRVGTTDTCQRKVWLSVAVVLQHNMPAWVLKVKVGFHSEKAAQILQERSVFIIT